MSTSIGKLQVDFVANLDKFIAGVKTAMKKMDEFAKKVGDSLKKLESGLKEIGEKMTKFVTVPLLALAAAAIKAADPTGAFAKELKMLGVEALLALEPLGEVLIEMIREAEPYIRKAIGYVHALMEMFQELEPATKRLVVEIAAGAAAIGPLAIAGAGLVAVVGALAPGFGALWKALSAVAALSVPLLKLTVALTGMASVAYVAWRGGNALYEMSQGLQTSIENLRYTAEAFAAGIRRDVKLTIADIKSGFSGLPDNLMGMVFGGAGLSFAKEIAGFKEAGNAARENSRIWAEWSEQVANLEEVHKTTLAAIDRDFAQHSERKSFGEMMAEDFALVQKAAAGLLPDFDAITERAEAWAKVSPEMAKAWQKIVDDLKNANHKLEETFSQKVEKKIKGFASSVGDAFADLALDGENSFAALAKSFEKMLISMFATQLMFQPIFDELARIGGGIAARMPTGGPTTGGGSAGVDMNLPGAALSNDFRMGGGGTIVNVIDQRSGGAPIDVQQRAGPDGRTIDVIVRDSVKKLLRNGDLDKDMRLAFGASRSGRV